MFRIATLLVLAALSSTVASAERRREPPVEFEVGFNNRQFAALPGEMTAFRGPIADPAVQANVAHTVSLRFTTATRRGVFLGGEAETGVLATPGSNLAGAYGVAGVRGRIGERIAVAAELAAGGRWIRYGDKYDDVARLVGEPRVRAEVWLHPQWTLGGAIGSTLGARDVWMVGVYVGVHSLPFGQR